MELLAKVGERWRACADPADFTHNEQAADESEAARLTPFGLRDLVHRDYELRRFAR